MFSNSYFIEISKEQIQNSVKYANFEIYRNEKDLSKPFRIADTDDMLAYKAIHIEKVPKYTSAFTAVTSDNADEAIAAAMTSKTHKDSPLEKIVMV